MIKGRRSLMPPSKSSSSIKGALHLGSTGSKPMLKGRFRMHLDSGDIVGPLRVKVAPHGFAALETEVPVGATKLEFRLDRAAQLEGSVLLTPEEARQARFVVRLEGKTVGQVAWFPKEDGTRRIPSQRPPRGSTDPPGACPPREVAPLPADLRKPRRRDRKTRAPAGTRPAMRE